MKRRYRKRWVIRDAEWSKGQPITPRIFRNEARALQYLGRRIQRLLGQYPLIPENTRLALLQQIHRGEVREALAGFLESMSGAYGGRDDALTIEEAREYVEPRKLYHVVVSRSSFKQEVLDDPDRPNFETWAAELRYDAERDYNEGHTVYVGVRARVDIQIPNASGGHIVHTIATGGVWQVGITGNRGRRAPNENDERHLQELYEEQAEDLAGMLARMGIRMKP